jgi:mono/diheme cytochrome c family protein
MLRGAVLLVTNVLALAVLATDARAADARLGAQLAQSHCADCHIVTPNARNEVADAPPFDVIGRKYGFDAGAITHAITGPHAKMNFSPNRREAADIAAYIATLGH